MIVQSIRITTAILAAATVVGLGACTKVVPETEPPRTANPTTVVTPTTPARATTTPRTTAAPSTTNAAPTTQAGPAPSVGPLTAPGTQLKLGEPATLVYELSDVKTTLIVKPTTITKGDPKDLAGVNISNEELKGGTPWYATVEYTNLSGPADESPYYNVKLRAVDAAGQAVSSIIVIGKDKCDEIEPLDNKSEVGKPHLECKIFVAKAGQEVAALTWRGDYSSAQPVTWKP